tara:strand:+ start:4564 stop:4944 length:381 start_codon:yes stop_codon:yes gene_type:complete
MKEIKIITTTDDVLIQCPNCKEWEEAGIDEPRKRFVHIPIIEWLEDKKDRNEKSINECSECKEKFKVEWDYTNDLEKLEKKIFDFLDNLRDTAITNMLGATPYIVKEFKVTKETAKILLVSWIKKA